MIQNYNRLAMQVEVINKEIQGAQIQKIMSSSRFLVFGLRKPGKTIYLYIGRGKGYEGIWLGDSTLEANLRVKDKFLEYLRSYTTNRRIKNISVDSKDRILILDFSINKPDKFLIFYCGRELYFANTDDLNFPGKIFTSWKGLEKCNFDPVEVFDAVGRKEVVKTEESNFFEIDHLIENEKKDQDKTAIKLESKNAKKTKRKINNIEKDLEKIRKWKNLKETIETQDLSLLDQRCEILGYKFRFDKENHYSRASVVHDKIKRLKLAESLMEKRLNEVLSKKIDDKICEKNTLQVIAPKWIEKRKSEPSRESNKDFSVESFDGYDVGYGKSANGNDQLRSMWGKKEDWWLHADNSPSTHVVIKIKDSKIDILDIIDISKKYFKINSEIDIIYTKLKNVKSVKGSPGKVLFKKEKRIRLKNE